MQETDRCDKKYCPKGFASGDIVLGMSSNRKMFYEEENGAEELAKVGRIVYRERQLTTTNA